MFYDLNKNAFIDLKIMIKSMVKIKI